HVHSLSRTPCSTPSSPLFPSRRSSDLNNSYYAKVKDQLALGQHIGADLVTLTDWMASRWIRLGYAQELNPDNIPNRKNLEPALADRKSTRLNSSHVKISYAVFCLKKKS